MDISHQTGTTGLGGLGVFPHGGLPVGLAILFLVKRLGLKAPGPGRGDLRQAIDLSRDRPVPRLAIPDVQEQPGITTNKAAPVGFGDSPPEPAACYQRLVLPLPLGFVLGAVLVVTLDDLRIRLPASGDDLLDRAMGDAAPAVHGVQVVERDFLGESVLAPCLWPLRVMANALVQQAHSGTRDGTAHRVIDREVEFVSHGQSDFRMRPGLSVSRTSSTEESAHGQPWSGW
ncbi:hypothetical protein G6F24_013019 [Rhizopus arrhizus]|nr:hypothetical protein G6F24_013019 [Rhizopus arrhizus]